MAKSMRLEKESDGTMSGGAAWIERFLLPRLHSRFPADGSSISCLQIAPDDETEAQMLRELGYRCELCDPGNVRALSYPDSSFDFVFTGRFPVLAPNPESKVVLARELHRILRPAGSLLLVFGNRRCPIDLTRNGPLIHGPTSRSTLQFSEASEILIEQAGFSSMVPQNVAGHFGWGSIPSLARPFGKILDAYWRVIGTPERRWLYTSLLNPTLILWLNKD